MDDVSQSVLHNGNTSSRVSMSEMSRRCSFTEEVKLKSLTASTFYDRLLYVLLCVVLCYVLLLYRWPLLCVCAGFCVPRYGLGE